MQVEAAVAVTARYRKGPPDLPSGAHRHPSPTRRVVVASPLVGTNLYLPRGGETARPPPSASAPPSRCSPVVRRQNEAWALAFRHLAHVQGAGIMIGVVSILAVVTLRQDLAAPPPDRTGLTDHLTRQRFTLDELLAAGLTRRTGAGRMVDVYATGSLIRDAPAQTVAFIGRAAPRASPRRPEIPQHPQQRHLPQGTDAVRAGRAGRPASSRLGAVLVERPMDVLAVATCGRS
jgi:hypothetical protein